MSVSQVRIWSSNLRTALQLAIDALEERGMGKSALCEGYREIIKAMNEGKSVVVG